ncbi:hypothetical protein CERZMDRAFT_95338 [Cercospora zeae-maydis SCOH1-5]|uniref:Uncharacterized protein n=1 Tax=Cercospora zeae-maydis SCOH1-5 TaxID=717836 RepID=A0A6A6FND4_9PEZI|nr:hypothetical protein CERZMDRAFT_95338 [Cercospora zeae-maydis SCOH1-5]
MTEAEIENICSDDRSFHDGVAAKFFLDHLVDSDQRGSNLQWLSVTAWKGHFNVLKDGCVDSVAQFRRQLEKLERLDWRIAGGLYGLLLVRVGCLVSCVYGDLVSRRYWQVLGLEGRRTLCS